MTELMRGRIVENFMLEWMVFRKMFNFCKGGS